MPLGDVGAVARDPRLAAWIDAMLAAPGLTAIRDRDAAFRQHVVDSLAAVPLLASTEGSIMDVGSGGGAPGLPLAAAFPDREVTLLESASRKCDFLRRAAGPFANVRVVHGRAEEQEPDSCGVAVAKALAEPPVAAEWCLPLVREGGAVVLWVGPSAEHGRLATVAGRLAAVVEPAPAGFVVLRKVGPTPPGFPRRPGIARKRPLA